ncbi:MAG: chemotaxis protein CheB [Mucilaginibacter sp.]|uniref:chemotaxis protein CheB n=1 Tax=Mucilaginibacter sp. TaxID=1882438 RepID=UPI0034E443A8
MAQVKSVIVVGASAGGLQAISQLLEKIPQNLDAAILVVLHVSRHSLGDVLVHHLQKRTTFACSIPKNGEQVQARHVYIAKPDFHMLIAADETIRFIKGPHENRWRPSIDVLFRSAAVVFNSKTIGIILTGLLDDGTAGMMAIKRCGGICIVQEPDEAQFGDMPTNVLNHVEVDYRVPIADMGYILDDMKSKPEKPAAVVPEDIRTEAEMTENMVSSIDQLKTIGTQSDYTCPDCGGTLFMLNHGGLHRYRCFTGHVYTEKLLLDKQSESLEESLWTTIRRLEERRSLLQTTAQHLHEVNQPEMQSEKQNTAAELSVYIEKLKALLTSLSVNGPNNFVYE